MKARILVGIAFVGTCNLLGQTNQIAASTSKTLPAILTTADGKIYKSVEFIRSDPDGLVIEYAPTSGAIGVAKVKFELLSPELQQNFGYDPSAANSHQQARLKAEAALRTKMTVEQERANLIIRAREKENFQGLLEREKLENERRKNEAARVQAEADRKEAQAALIRAEKQQPTQVNVQQNNYNRYW